MNICTCDIMHLFTGNKICHEYIYVKIMIYTHTLPFSHVARDTFQVLENHGRPSRLIPFLR